MVGRGAAATAALTAVAAAVCYVYWRRRRHKRAPEPLPPALVISLARFPAARKACLTRAADAGLEQVDVFEAVEGRALSLDELRRRGVAVYSGWRIPDSTFRFFDRELKWGEVGCALSHVGVWREVSAMQAPRRGPAAWWPAWLPEPVAIVLEDDVDFLPRFAELLREALDELALLVEEGIVPPPDAMYLGRKAMRPEHDRLLPRATCGAAKSQVRICVPGFSYKTTAYLLWQRGAHKLLLSGYEGKLIPVDDFLALTYAQHEAKKGEARPDLDALFADAPRLNMLAVRPSLCRERRGISSTENSKSIA